MMKKLGALLIVFLAACVAAVATVPTYNGFTARSSGYIVTATEWNYEFQALITFINTTIITPLNTLSTAPGNLLTGDGTNLQVFPSSGASNGQFLSYNSAQPYGLQWASLVSGVTALTTLGDTLVYGPSGLTRLPAGANGTVLTADSTQANGVAYEAGIPSGSIVMWSGSIATIPTGWYLCNGQTTPSGNVTPNLQGLFVIGAGNNAPAAGGFGILSPGSVIGSNAHTHGIAVSGSTSQGTNATAVVASGGTVTTSISSHTHTFAYSGNTGVTATLPSAYTLCYIEKN